MEVAQWFAEHWFDLVETVSVVGGLVFTAHTIRKDERARKIGNLIAVNQQYSDIWREMYDRPELARILKKAADLRNQPVTDQERFFVKMLIQHLHTVQWAIRLGVFVSIQGLSKDIQEFFSLPIPKAVWEGIKLFQDRDFVRFIEETRAARNFGDDID